MPTYNQARFIGTAIQSVVQQTFTAWELLIMDDGSTDDTRAIIAQFDEPRIRYIYQHNQGVSTARNVGIAQARGDYLAFLDADDLYEPHKLAVQVARLDQQPAIGLTYGSRTEIDQQGNPVRLTRLPATASLASIVLGFPFAPTDLMVRRFWVERVGGFRPGLVVNEDRDLYIRLVLAGCQCVGCEAFLAYRRLDTDKTFSNLPAKLADMVCALETAFHDPRCPTDVQALSAQAYATIYLDWAYQAAIQGESTLAQGYFRQGLHYRPALLNKETIPFLYGLIQTAARDGGDVETRLRQVFAQLPPEMVRLSKACDWAIAHGYFWRGLSHCLWGRLELAHCDFVRAAMLQRKLGITLDKPFLQKTTEQLLNYKAKFGGVATQSTFQKLICCLEQSGITAGARWLYGCYTINLAFDFYRNEQYKQVPGTVIRALVHDPFYLLNRGVLAILVRSSIPALRPSVN